jgi:hypothetical protein
MRINVGIAFLISRKFLGKRPSRFLKPARSK